MPLLPHPIDRRPAVNAIPGGICMGSGPGRTREDTEIRLSRVAHRVLRLVEGEIARQGGGVANDPY